MAFGDLINNPLVDRTSSNFFSAAFDLNFASTITAGNLVLVAMTGNALVTPAGYVRVAFAQNTANARDHALYAKVGVGTETLVNLQSSGGGNTYCSMYEFEGPYDATPAGAVATADNAGSTSVTFSAGPITTTSDSALVFTFANHNSGTPSANTIDNAFTVSGDNHGADSSAGVVGYKVLTATATIEPVVTWGEGVVQGSGMTVEFKAAGAVDTSPPSYTSAPAVSSLTFEGGTATSIINEVGDTYFVVVPDAATAPTVAEVIAGTGSGGAGQVAVGSSLASSTLVQPFTGCAESTAYKVYFVSRDDEPTPNVQVAVTSVSFTTTAQVLVATSITAGTIYEGDSVVIQLADAPNAAGRTLSCSSGAIIVTAQDATSVTFSAMDVKVFGDKKLGYSETIIITVTDAGESDTINLTITPTVGFDTATVTAIEGIYLDDVTVEVSDYSYGKFLSGSGTMDLASGNFTRSVHSRYQYWVKDASDGVWSDPITETFKDATGKYVTITLPVDTSTDSVFSGYAKTAPVNGDEIVHDLVTTPSGLTVSVTSRGVVSLSSTPTQTEYFNFYVVHADHTYETKAAVAVSPSLALVITGINPVALGQVFTITTQGNYNLTEAIEVTATIEGVDLGQASNITTNTCTFTCPASGLSLVATSDVILTITI